MRKFIRNKLEALAKRILKNYISENYVSRVKIELAYSAVAEHSSQNLPMSLIADTMHTLIKEGRDQLTNPELTSLKTAIGYYKVNILGKDVPMGPQEAYDKGQEHGIRLGKSQSIENVHLRLKQVKEWVDSSKADFRIKGMVNEFCAELEQVITMPRSTHHLMMLPNIIDIPIDKHENFSVSDLQAYIKYLSKYHYNKRYKLLLEYIDQQIKKATSN